MRAVNDKRTKVGIIGGGAAGFFSALSIAETDSNCNVTIIEGSNRPLAKVAISGGGRCNVTHHCFDIKELVKNYPRGGRELLGPFSRFQPQDTIDWFARHGVSLKTESDGRMFPTTDNSASVVNALKDVAKVSGVRLLTNARVSNVELAEGFTIMCSNAERFHFDKVIIATGGAPVGHRLASSLGHSITTIAPSLFTFKVEDATLRALSGIAINSCKVKLMIKGEEIVHSEGPILITHWGLSGPAILRISAWGARELASTKYKAQVRINWLPNISAEQLRKVLRNAREHSGHRTVGAHPMFDLPRRFWERVLARTNILGTLRFSGLSNAQLEALTDSLSSEELEICGKGEYKEEFVTCGGVNLREVDLRTMESKLRPALYFAGEVLDIDGLTGGFNFQAAWTTGWIAGQAIASRSNV